MRIASLYPENGRRISRSAGRGTTSPWLRPCRPAQTPPSSA